MLSYIHNSLHIRSTLALLKRAFGAYLIWSKSCISSSELVVNQNLHV